MSKISQADLIIKKQAIKCDIVVTLNRLADKFNPRPNISNALHKINYYCFVSNEIKKYFDTFYRYCTQPYSLNTRDKLYSYIRRLQAVINDKIDTVELVCKYAKYKDNATNSYEKQFWGNLLSYQMKECKRYINYNSKDEDSFDIPNPIDAKRYANMVASLRDWLKDFAFYEQFINKFGREKLQESMSFIDWGTVSPETFSALEIKHLRYIANCCPTVDEAIKYIKAHRKEFLVNTKYYCEFAIDHLQVELGINWNIYDYTQDIRDRFHNLESECANIKPILKALTAKLCKIVEDDIYLLDKAYKGIEQCKSQYEANKEYYFIQMINDLSSLAQFKNKHLAEGELQ